MTAEKEATSTVRSSDADHSSTGYTPAQDYPFDSKLFDSRLADGSDIQHQLFNVLKFSTAGSNHKLNNDITEEEAANEFRVALKLSDINLYFIPHRYQQTLGLTRASLISLLEHAKVPPTFIETLASNSGAFCSSEIVDHNGTTKGLSIQVRVPLGPFLNGALYFQYDAVSENTTALVFFEDRLLLRLKDGLSVGSNPGLILSMFMTESYRLIEEHRKKLDRDVVQREQSTGTTLVTTPYSTTPIDEYQPLFDRLHYSQQHLMYMEPTIGFLIRLLDFFAEQHLTISKLRLTHSEGRPDRGDIFAQRQLVLNSLNSSRSLLENALHQVEILSLRIRIQLSLVDSRLQQSNGQTQVSIAEETKKDSIAMKIIAAVTMIFLPGTFTASFFSMPFFNAEIGYYGRFTANQLWWLYPAVTVPLTLCVILIWVAWLRYLDVPLLGKRNTSK